MTTQQIIDWFNDGVFHTVLLLAFWATVVPIGGYLVCGLAQRKLSASARCCVWQWLLVGLLALPALTLLTPGIPLGMLQSSESRVTLATESTAEPASIELQRDGERIVADSPSADRAPIATRLDERTDALQPAATRPTVRDNVGKSVVAAVSYSIRPWRAIVAAAWLSGIALFQARLLVSVSTTWSKRRRGRPITDVRIRRLFEATVGQMSIVRRVDVFVSPDIPVPFATGMFRPAVVLPIEAVHWPEDRLRMVLLHELAHVERRDVMWQTVSRIAASMYWFHPFVWLACREMRTQRERACDNRALTTGEVASEYAAGLLEIAAALGGRKVRLLEAVGIAQLDLENRLRFILDSSEIRARASCRFRWTVIVTGLCVVFALANIRPFTPAPTVKADETPDNNSSTATERDAKPSEVIEATAKSPKENEPAAAQPLLRLPESLVGEIVSEDGKPIAQAQVVVELRDRGADSAIVTMTYQQRLIRRWRAVTDEQGRYEIDASELPPQPPHRYFAGSVRAEGYAEREMRYARTIEKTARDEWVLETIRMPRGRVVEGRVVDPSGQPLKNVVIQKSGHFETNGPWFPTPSGANDDGTFSITVPEAIDVVLWIVAKGWNARRLEVTAAQVDLGDIRLHPGARVFGQVVDRDGEPVAGAVVAMEREQDEPVAVFGTSLRFAAKTNAKGRYFFPPVLGKHKVWVTRGGLTHDRVTENYLIADTAPPLIAPQLVELDGSERHHELNFRAGPTLTARGTIRWANGEQARNVYITFGTIMEGARGGVTLGITHSDENGRYGIELPKPMRDVHINVFGAKDDSGTWHQAYPSDHVRAHRKQAQFMTFKLLQEDLEGADWELHVVDPDEPRVFGSPRQPQADDHSAPPLRSTRSISAHDSMVRYLVWSPSGQTLASGSLGGEGGDEFALWQTATGEEEWRVKLPRGESLCSLAFSPDGKLLAAGGGGKIFLHDADTGRRRRTLVGHGGACVVCCAFSPDGKTLATGGGMHDNTIHLWNLPSGERQAILSGHQTEVLSVTFTRDGGTLFSAAGQKDATVRVWDVTQAELKQTLGEFAGSWAQAFSLGGKSFAEARGGDVFLWELPGGRLIQALKNRGDGSTPANRLVQTVAYSPDGKRIATAAGNSLSIWDLATGRRERVGETGTSVNSITFDPSGDRVASGDSDGNITIWTMK